jgi:hypothetical protein
MHRQALSATKIGLITDIRGPKVQSSKALFVLHRCVVINGYGPDEKGFELPGRGE